MTLTSDLFQNYYPACQAHSGISMDSVVFVIFLYYPLHLFFHNLLFITVISSIQVDQNVSVHLMITVQKHAKIFYTVTNTYYDKVVRVRGNRWR
jgi:hypothetical protein